MEKKRAMAAATAIVALAVVASLVGVEAQPACAAQLSACGPYLNATSKPPESCCGPMREAVKNDMACLCAILENPSVSRAFNITPDNASRLAKACGLADDQMNGCAPAPAVPPPPASSGGGATYKTHWINGMSSLFLFATWLIIA
ncbi:lipid transfer-like protein VAS [Canna indica]|uniref:Lipid transfer-like protein VAS n=1 Tax=Canna indica TaxID=4628 RepID=A0AAQ3Q9J3_9LILI|nr:lipid transfer-like protein VAS [Canna indica]